MNLHRLLAQRAEAGKPVRVGVIGGGKFGTMFLAQARCTPGPARPRRGRPAAGPRAPLDAGRRLARRATRRARPRDRAGDGRTHVGDDGMALIAASGLDVLVEATGDPRAGTRHALAALEHGRHLVMVNVETDVLVGPLLAERARKAGLVYSLAYGDQPALICEMVDWARASGFEMVCAGKGTRYLPHFSNTTLPRLRSPCAPSFVDLHGVLAEPAALLELVGGAAAERVTSPRPDEPAHPGRRLPLHEPGQPDQDVLRRGAGAGDGDVPAGVPRGDGRVGRSGMP